MLIAVIRVVIVAGIGIIDFSNESLPILTRTLRKSLADRLLLGCSSGFGNGRKSGALFFPTILPVAFARLAAISSRVSLHSE
jgi:hypothetical protein